MYVSTGFLCQFPLREVEGFSSQYDLAGITIYAEFMFSLDILL